nr:ribonuclease E/G [Hyphomonas sp. Mor2]
MSKLMLIDAVHQEETRVALVNNGRVEDFDFETTGSEQLRGNIYLAKVTRVEPSLQACFVEYGGNRHGFLAFNEIHPDYYQLPQADREALLEEAAREAEEAADDDPDDEDDLDDIDSEADEADEDEADASADDADEDDEEASNEADADDESHAEDTTESDADEETEANAENDAVEEDAGEEKKKKSAKPERRRRGARKSRGTSITRRYKIQEVIRRRQVLLVQVVKEERGNKGAALTTYLSLAGRYSVLMPNTPRGGGISRKIPNGNDRKRLKSVMDGLQVPKGMGLIVRTAGAKRTKSEIRRDYDYLQKLWSNIRSKTLESVAPELIHEEGGLVHRAMRDMFDREISEVVVQGDRAYREAKDLAKTLMPTQAKKVKRWTAQAPLFVKEGVEDQLDSIFSPTVQMKSGGYLVINQTEALVAIDVNSGKSTRERNIEQTALHTNLEAAEEACRQMRLRDLAGLVVIDFIDMDENKNNRSVEKKMKEALKLDRARVQNNRISQFGLMEISRQRRRAGVLQATSDKCEACDGTGRRRSIPSAALQLLRAVEARASGGGLRGMTVTAPTDVALYLLNSKRDSISAIEDEAGFTIAIKSSGAMIPGDFELDADKASSGRRRRKKFNREEFLEGDADDHLLPDAEEDEDEDEVDAATPESEDEGDESGGRRKRRRRGRRGGRRRRKEGESMDPGAPPSDGGALLDGLALSISNLLGDEPDDLPEASEGGLSAKPVAVPEARAPEAETKSEENAEAEADEEPKEGKKRRRRRRRKRRGGDGVGAPEASEAQADGDAPEASEEPSDATPSGPAEEPVIVALDPDPTPEPEAPTEPEPVAASEPAPEVDPEPEVIEDPTPEPEPEPEPELVSEPVAPITTEPVLESSSKPKKKKRGWWSRG